MEEDSSRVTVCGFVRDAESCEPLVGASVMLVNQSPCRAATNFAGLYCMRCVRPGNVVISVSYFGYPRVQDTVVIDADAGDRMIDFELSNCKSVPALMRELFTEHERDALQSYRDSLHAIQAQGVPLQITIDSLWWRDDGSIPLHAIMKYSNRSDMTICVLKGAPPVLTSMIPVIVNSRGDTVRVFVRYYDFMGMKDAYDETDLLEIPAHTSVKSEAVFDVQSDIPPDRYRIRITYQHHIPKCLGYMSHSVRTDLLVRLKTIEGRIQSDNEYMLTVPQHR